MVVDGLCAGQPGFESRGGHHLCWEFVLLGFSRYGLCHGNDQSVPATERKALVSWCIRWGGTPPRFRLRASDSSCSRSSQPTGLSPHNGEHASLITAQVVSGSQILIYRFSFHFILHVHQLLVTYRQGALWGALSPGSKNRCLETLLELKKMHG